MTAPTPTRSAARRLSQWAVGALVCSALGLLPIVGALFAVLGILLAVLAFFDFRRNPHFRGRSLAVAALATGLVLFVVWLALARWWHVRVRTPILNGPLPELLVGQAGDVAGFSEGFVDYPTDDKNQDAAEFLSELTRRYGDLRSIDPRNTGDKIRVGEIDRLRQRIPYRMMFKFGPVDAEAVFVVRGEERFLPLIARWESLTMLDAEAGDLSYPPDTRGQGRDGSE